VERKEQMSKVILYTRCSTTKTESDTRAAQLTELRQYAAQNNMEVVGEFSDLCSGRELECRTGLLSALELASVENASIAAVELSRLSRNVGDVANLLNSDMSIILTRSGRQLSKEMVLVLQLCSPTD
jgi:DNA invertase Pin-like site-specific DNA recombinase